jgi:UDP-2,3-diacylglucosamine pyrophosphatase LpxH
MKYLVISDLHLGDGSYSDDFKYKNSEPIKYFDKKIIKWIEEQEVDVLILNGDIYENWQHSTKSIYRAHTNLINYFKEKLDNEEAIYIHGNHDYSLVGKTSHILTMNNKEKILIEHGYKNDKNMTNPLVRFGVWCLGLIEKIIPNIDQIKNPFKEKHSIDFEIEKNAYDYAKSKMNFKYVVLGHTHSLAEDGHYFNCGTCHHGRLEGVYIDTEMDFIKLIKG